LIVCNFMKFVIVAISFCAIFTNFKSLISIPAI
jgi:hypothetical protein